MKEQANKVLESALINGFIGPDEVVLVFNYISWLEGRIQGMEEAIEYSKKAKTPNLSSFLCDLCGRPANVVDDFIDGSPCRSLCLEHYTDLKARLKP